MTRSPAIAVVCLALVLAAATPSLAAVIERRAVTITRDVAGVEREVDLNPVGEVGSTCP